MSQTIVIERGGPGFLVRAVWFVFIGWWATGVLIGVAWFAMLTLIGIPLFAYLINRIPGVLTLARRTTRYETALMADGTTVVRELRAEQRPIWQRAIYLVLIGWWFSAIWMGVAYFLCVIVVGLPIGIWMFHRTPFLATLMRY